jgi:hypothetical protein
MNEESKLKLWRIAKALRERSSDAAVQWTETDVRGRFAAVVGDSSFVMDKADDEEAYRITVQDPEGRPVETWLVGPGSGFTFGVGGVSHTRVGAGSNFRPEDADESMLTIVRDMYEIVRRDVWGVDETLDAVLRDLDG